MDKLRRFLCALTLLFTSFLVTSVALSSTPAKVAALTNCQLGGEAYPGGRYAGVICFDCCYAGTRVRLKATCRVDYDSGATHVHGTYLDYSPYVYEDTWTWSHCDNYPVGADRIQSVVMQQI